MIKPLVDTKNGDKEPHQTVLIDFRRPEDVESSLRRDVIGKLAKLSPATKRMLYMVYAALIIEKDPVKGYSFRIGLTRADLADLMHKTQLAPYDIKKLRKLVQAGLLTETRRALPAKAFIGKDGLLQWLGSGFEFVYGMNEWQLRPMTLLHDPLAFMHLPERDPEREANDARIKQRIAEMRSESAKQDRQLPKPANTKPLTTDVVRMSKPSLIERLVDFFTL